MDPDIVLYTSLIDGLCKAGKVKDGYKLVCELRDKGLQPNLHTYHVMIGGFFTNGKLEHAKRLLDDMKVEGCTMDGVFYNLVIQGFLRYNKTSTALNYLEQMTGDGFSKNVNTTNILVRLLATKELDNAHKRYDAEQLTLSLCIPTTSNRHGSHGSKRAPRMHFKKLRKIK